MDSLISSLNLDDFKKDFSSAQKISILLKKEPNFDILAAGLSLYLGLKKLGKDIEIYSQTPPIVEQSSLIAIDKIKNQISNKNLVISFDYTEGAIERVSYNIKDNKFNLIIEPKKGFPALSPKKVSYSYSGVSADLIFTIGCLKIEDLGEVATKEKEFLEKTPIANIEIRKNGDFAKYKIFSTEVFSYSEIILGLFSFLGMEVDSDIATNILAGIEYATGSFSDPRIGVSTFETVVFLLKKGARRQKIPSFKPEEQKRVEEVVIKEEKRVPAGQKESPPVDWLQPKIYKGGQLL